MPLTSLRAEHLMLRTSQDVYELFRLLGYQVEPQVFEGADLADLELAEVDAPYVQRVHILADHGSHTVYFFEVSDLSQVRLRGLAWNALQRGGTTLLVVTRDYREVVFVDPRFAGNPTKSNIRVNKLKVVTSDPTRHDLDTINAIHAHRRTTAEIDAAQAEAFNITRITKRFYDQYRDHYDRARQLIQQHNQGIREFHDGSNKLHAFTQRLLGRLMFLYFLQRKGWLGGRQKFLTEAYLNTMRRHSGELRQDRETSYYYREVLEPLFFETMNTKRPDNITQWPGIKIPYLNGGLFDQSRDPQGIIVIPDSVFDPNSDEGLLGFFNRYNFTIADDTPLEQDVSVDPEMLGKVFENLLEEQDRGQSGSFYTPRTIVAYMCQEALAGYVEESTNVSRETTRAQFDPDSELRLTAEEAERVNAALDTVTVLDPAVGSGSFPIGMMQEIVRLRRACAEALNVEVTPNLLADWKEAIIRDTLYGVDIKPEAIEIAQLRLWLALVVNQTLEEARPLPNLDYKLMAGNSLIETIDGEPVLGETAATFLDPDTPAAQWEDVNSQLKLFDPNPKQARMALFDDEKQVQHERVKLDEMRREFFRATPEERRHLRAEISAQERRIVAASLREKGQKLQAQIDEMGKKAARQQGILSRLDQKKLTDAANKLVRIDALERDLWNPEKPLPFFLYRLHFSDVFERKGGFDIVVANPPYVRHESITDQKLELKLTFPLFYDGMADLYTYFYVRGLQLTKINGVIAYISSNKFFKVGYGKKLREHLIKSVEIANIVDFGELPVFREAATFPAILLAQKSLKPNSMRYTTIKEWSDQLDIRRIVNQHNLLIPYSSLGSEGWAFSDQNTEKLLAKMRSAGISLAEYTNNKFYSGVKSGFKAAFEIDTLTKDELIRIDPQSAEIIKPYSVGDDIRKWTLHQRDNWLIYSPWDLDIEEYPAIKSHLIKWKEQLMARPECKAGRYNWWCLARYAAGYIEEFSKPKIVYPEMAMYSRFAFDTKGIVTNNKGFIIPVDDMFLLGILNSLAVWQFLKSVCSVIGDPNAGGRLELRSAYLDQLPIPNPSSNLRDQIAALAQRCLDVAKSTPESLPALEAELNALVYKAYGLDEDDIRVIERYLGERGTRATAVVDSDIGDEDGISQ